MRLYYDQKGGWAGTQSDAKKAFGKDWWEIDVPTSKTEMLEFLNLHNCLRDPNNDVHPVTLDGAESPRVAGMMRYPEPTPPTQTGITCSEYKPARDLNAYDVRDVVTVCDRKHLGSALGAIISRLHDELGEV